MKTTVVLTLLVMVGLVAASGKRLPATTKPPSKATVSQLKAQLLAAMETEAAKQATLLRPTAPVSQILPSATGEVNLTASLQSEYGRQTLAPILYGPRPDHVDLALGLLSPCCGTCNQGYRRGYCSFWWVGCGWGRPLYHAHGCCGRYCVCCDYGHLFNDGHSHGGVVFPSSIS